MTEVRKNRSLKKHQGQTMEKQEKKVKKTPQPKKAPKLPEFIDSSEEEEEGLPKDNKGKKIPPLLWVREVQSFFDLPKDSKNLTITKKVERVVFMGGPMKSTNYHMLHYMIPNTSKSC